MYFLLMHSLCSCNSDSNIQRLFVANTPLFLAPQLHFAPSIISRFHPSPSFSFVFLLIRLDWGFRLFFVCVFVHLILLPLIWLRPGHESVLVISVLFFSVFSFSFFFLYDISAELAFSCHFSLLFPRLCFLYSYALPWIVKARFGHLFTPDETYWQFKGVLGSACHVASITMSLLVWNCCSFCIMFNGSQS